METVPALELFHYFRRDVDCLPVRARFWIRGRVDRNFDTSDAVAEAFFSCSFDLFECVLYFLVPLETSQ